MLSKCTDDKTNKTEQCLVAVRLNYKSVTEPCVFTDHLIQNILHFRTIEILLFISDESFLCFTFTNVASGFTSWTTQNITHGTCCNVSIKSLY